MRQTDTHTHTHNGSTLGGVVASYKLQNVKQPIHAYTWSKYLHNKEQPLKYFWQYREWIGVTVCIVAGSQANKNIQ